MRNILFPFLVTMAFFCLLFKFIHTPQRSFRAFTKTLESFHKEHPSLKDLQLEDVISLAGIWQDRLARSLILKKDYRRIDFEKVKLLESVLAKGGAQVFMRHGEQKLSKRLLEMQPERLRKIEMMRNPENLQNPITDISLVEVLAVGIIFSHLKEKNGKNFSIHTSANKRASQVAKCLGSLTQTDPDLLPKLTCINYPDGEKFPSHYLQRELSSGVLPWEKESIDYIVGAGTYAKIMDQIKEELRAPYAPDLCTIYLTHTQQINSVQKLNHLPLKRISHLGMIILVEDAVFDFPTGIFQ